MNLIYERLADAICASRRIDRNQLVKCNCENAVDARSVLVHNLKILGCTTSDIMLLSGMKRNTINKINASYDRHKWGIRETERDIAEVVQELKTALE